MRFISRLVLVGSFVTLLWFPAVGGAADGDLDTTFSADGRQRVAFDLDVDAADMATAVAVGSSGTIVAAGLASITDPNHSHAVALVRLLPSGAPDGGFSSDGEFSFVPTDGVDPLFPPALAVATDGSIFVAGKSRETPQGGGRFVCKILPAGGLDTTFGSLGCVSESDCAIGNVPDSRCHYSAIVESAGSLYLAGSYLDFPVGAPSSADWEFLVEKRSASTGAADPTFSADGRVVVPFDLDGESADETRALALGPDGTIFVAGGADADLTLGLPVLAVAALTPAGDLDAGFGVGGRFAEVEGVATGVVVDALGRLVVAGGSSGETAVLRFLATGEIDLAFGTGGLALHPGLGGAAGLTLGLAVGSDGRPALALKRADGLFSAARLTAGGALDPSFASDGVAEISFTDGSGGDFASTAAVALEGGRVLLAGLAEWNGVDTDFGIVRLRGELVFSGGFESGGVWSWGVSVP